MLADISVSVFQLPYRIHASLPPFYNINMQGEYFSRSCRPQHVASAPPSRHLWLLPRAGTAISAAFTQPWRDRRRAEGLFSTQA